MSVICEVCDLPLGEGWCSSCSDEADARTEHCQIGPVLVDVPVSPQTSLLSPAGRAAARIALALAKRVEDPST